MADNIAARDRVAILHGASKSLRKADIDFLFAPIEKAIQEAQRRAWDAGYLAAHIDEAESMPDHTKNPYGTGGKN